MYRKILAGFILAAFTGVVCTSVLAMLTHGGAGSRQSNMQMFAYPYFMSY